MRRTYKAAADTRTTDGLEFSRHLTKGYMDIAKRLDEQKNRALSLSEIFTPSGETLRVKLKDYCERLIVKDPVNNSRKIEEILWRKAFYDIVYAAKKLRKGNVWSETEKALLSVHLSVGVGFYHHLILRLQSEFDLDLVGVIDFAFTQTDTTLTDPKQKFGHAKSHNDEVKQCVIRLIHRSLVCLGDLARYRLDLDPNWDPMIAKRYYKMAISIDPNIGMPHNQLGTIASNRNYGLDAVYHYMRCVLCSEPFDGAEGNLKRAIALHSICAETASSMYKCISKLMALLQLWDYEIPNPDRINQECQDLLTHLENSFSENCSDSNNLKKFEFEDSIEAYLQSCRNENIDCLTDNVVFKIIAICLMSISRLKNRESSEVQSVVAISLAILSQLIQFTITKLQESFVDMRVPNMEHDFPEILRTVDIEPEHNIPVIQTDITTVIEDTKSILNAMNNEELTNNCVDFNDNKNSFVYEKMEAASNGHSGNMLKKTRQKTSSLLTKLRRPRKGGNSSDSDASDIEMTVVSSSDEINSDISDIEDVFSEKNVLSDDALSEDLPNEDKGTKINGTEVSSNDDIQNTVNEDIELSGNNCTDNTLNGECRKNENQRETIINKISLDNSESVGTTATNIDSNSTYDENSGSVNTIVYVAQLKKQSLKSQQILDVLEGREILASIKICFDWLKSNPDIIRICAKSTTVLLERVTVLLNLITIDVNELLTNWDNDSIFFSNVDKLKESIKVIPLPEDVDLRGLNVLDGAHKCLNWKLLHKHKINKREEMLVRVLKLIEFGNHLCSIEDSRVQFDKSKQLFTLVNLNNSNEEKDNRPNSTDQDIEHPRKKLMRHMGRLWLKAEVRALESRLRSRLISPYLVPDHDALAKHTATLKRLAFSKKFIIVIPAVVVSSLDEVKRISAKAREATRWLEVQLRKGSRFLRAQRPHESLTLPLIKGPRPKDKEAWLFFQIIECCHYLTQQTKVGLSSESDAPVVTLLTGCNPEEKRALNYSPEGLAKSAGVNIEYIETFHTKWKTSSKSHG